MADETTTTGQPGTPDATAADAGQTGQAAPATFTQEQLDVIVLDRVAQAKRSATAEISAELGTDDWVLAKKTLSEAKAAQAAQMTELEKAQAQIAEEKSLAAQAIAEAEVIKTQAAEALLKAAIMTKATDFHNPELVWKVIDWSKIEALEDGTYKGIDEALKSLAETDSYLVKADGQSGPGTPARAKRQTIVEKLIEGQQKKEAAGEPRRSTIRM